MEREAAQMPRPKNNPSFDPAKLEAEVLKTVVELFNAPDNPNHDISFIADELQMFCKRLQ